MSNGNEFTCRWTVAQREQLAESVLDQAWDFARPMLLAVIVQFLSRSLSPASVLDFERDLYTAVRSMGRIGHTI